MILEGFKKINEEQIARAENTLNISFHLDYKDFILSNNGMCAEGELGIALPLNQEIIAIDILYGIDTETENCNILEWTQEYKEDLPENTLIIGDDVLMGFFILVCKGEDKGVYYYDHAYNLESSDENGNTYFIANSFEEFINQLTVIE